VRHMSLSEAPDTEIYFPFAQGQQRDMTIVVRTSADPLRFAPALRRAIAALDTEQPISRMASMEQRLSDAIATRRFSATLLAIFAGLALALASIGVYGVVSFSVTRRKHEIGIRMALGAHTADVVRMVVRQGTSLALLGVGIGLAAAFALTRAIESLLYGVKTTDPLVFVGAPLLLTGVAALASYLPARRAARIDPGVALRYQ
jgi:putative ABC transport system permease protein